MGTDEHNDANPKPDISIIIPAYNEESRLAKTLDDILQYLAERKERFEVIVVDDGSADKTASVALQYEEKTKGVVRMLTYPANRGKGYAVKFGMTNGQGNLLLYNDADGATPIREIERLENAIAQGADIAIGSRAAFSRDTSVKTVWYRKFMGRSFNSIVNFLLLPGVMDTQCGFKMFKRHAAAEVFGKQKAERFSFDVELLFLARKAGFTVAEVPVNWTNIPGSKVNLVSDSFAMFCDLLRFRLRDLFGVYR